MRALVVERPSLTTSMTARREQQLRLAAQLAMFDRSALRSRRDLAAACLMLVYGPLATFHNPMLSPRSSQPGILAIVN